MNIEALEQHVRTYFEQTGEKLRPSECELFNPFHDEGDDSLLPPLLRPPKIWTGGKREFLGVHPKPFADSIQISDSAFLAYPRRPPAGNEYLMKSIDEGLKAISNEPIREHGGTRRRLKSRPAEISAGIESTLPYFLLYAHNLLESPGPWHPTDLAPYEDAAMNAARNIATCALNHDRYLTCGPSDLPQAVIPISNAIVKELKRMDVPYHITQTGDTSILQVTDPLSISRFYAAPTMEALVLPRRRHCPRVPITLYPGSKIARWQISVGCERPEGNPSIELLKIMTGVTDHKGNWTSVDHVQFINHDGTPGDHRRGMVNKLQNQAVIWKRDGSYARESRGGGEGDSIPENFPNDPDRAYCTLLRMCAEVLAKVYTRQYQFGDETPSIIEPLASEIRPSTDRLIGIVTNTGSIAQYKKIEGLQQLIVAHLNQPHTWASLANALGLEHIFPRAKPVWESLRAQPMVMDSRRPCTDDFIMATVRMPCIDIDPNSQTYRLDEPTGIERFIRYAETVVGIQIPKYLSHLGKLAWLYKPLPSA